MDTKLALTGHMECCDLQQGWVLHAVANCAVSSLGADALVSPRLKRGQVDCVFYNYSSVSVRTNLASMWACKLFYNAVAKHQSIPLRRIEESFIPYLAQQMHLQPHQLLVWVAGRRLLQRVRAKIKFFGSAFLWASGTCRNGSFVRSFNPI